MSGNSSLDEQFNKAVKLASKAEKLPPDVMLKFYAYYKQATKGDDFSFNANSEQKDKDVISSFKYNAWMQLRGISPKKAKKEYLKLFKEYIKIDLS